jgi:peptidyl-prolyl cis-trans isomerase C
MYSRRDRRFPLGAALSAVLALGAGIVVARADTPAASDPVVARVQGHDILLSDVRDAAHGLPPEMQQLAPEKLYPLIVNQLIDRKALVLEAEKMGLAKEPDVQKALDRAHDQALQQALLQHEVGPTLSDEALRARYQADIGSKPGEEEVHARHILVASEDQAKKIIEQLKKGADFAKLAKELSSDPGAQQGGDLGWFKKGDMVPEFSAVAFTLKPGQFTDAPVHTQFGWHVILVEEVRTAPPPDFTEAREQVRQAAIQDGVQKAVEKARQGLNIERFNPDGTVPSPTDTAEPPPPPKP